MNGARELLNWVHDKNLFTSLSKRITNPKTSKRSGSNEQPKKEKKSILNKALEKAKNLKNKSTKCVISSYLATEGCKVLNPIQNNYTKSSQHESFQNRKILLEKGCNNKLTNKPIGQDNPIQDALEKQEFWSDMGHCGNDVINSLHELQREKDKKATEEYEKWKEDNKEEGINKEDVPQDILEAEEEIVFGGYTSNKRKTRRKTKRKTRRKSKRKTRRKTKRKTRRKTQRKSKRKSRRKSKRKTRRKRKSKRK